jgi:tRNA pseudouridine38-40 synthase
MEKDQADHTSHPAPVRLAFRVSYLGSRFFGSQMQASSRTVEGEFVAACRKLGLFEDWREAGFLFAGRTDRGVHATGQVTAFTTAAPDRAIRTINSRLPPDCWCTGYAEVGPQFHPRFDAKSRTYRYYYAERPEDVAAMKTAAAAFLGTHDFSGFARVEDRNPLRTILRIGVLETDGYVCLEVTAESFLWHQVRGMAAALSLIGDGSGDNDLITRLLTNPHEKSLHPAPAEGLILYDTDCGIVWKPLTPHERSSGFVRDLSRHYALMEQVCRVVSPDKQLMEKTG